MQDWKETGLKSRFYYFGLQGIVTPGLWIIKPLLHQQHEQSYRRNGTTCPLLL